MTYIIAVSSFVAGFALGMRLKGLAFDSQDWMLMRWDYNSLGYRPIGFGTRLKKSDKIIMSLLVNTSDIPEDGIIYRQDGE